VSHVPGSADQAYYAVTERRKAFPWPLILGDPGIKLRLYYQGAPFGVPPPSYFPREVY
jgi:hypothetical protein